MPGMGTKKTTKLCTEAGDAAEVEGEIEPGGGFAIL